MSPSTPVSALTIAGSDSGGGAGIQADLKAFAAHRVHGLSAIAALTAQNTRGVTAVHVPPLDFLQAQIDACFADFDIHAVKLGMLVNAEVIELVATALEKHRPPHIILDPVMVATSGAKLLEDSALHALRTRLLPLATLVTPNTPEAELLLGRRIRNGEEAEDAASALTDLGAGAVLLKGGHLAEGSRVVDRFFDGVTFAGCRWPMPARRPSTMWRAACRAATRPGAARCWCWIISARRGRHDPFDTDSGAGR